MATMTINDLTDTKVIDTSTPIDLDYLVFNAGNPDSVITTALINQHIDTNVQLIPTHKDKHIALKNAFYGAITHNDKNAITYTTLKEMLIGDGIHYDNTDVYLNSHTTMLDIRKGQVDLGVLFRLSLALHKLNNHVKVIDTKEMALIWYNHNAAIKALAKRTEYTIVDVDDNIINDYIKFIDDLKHRLNDVTVYEIPLITGKEYLPVMYGDSFTSPFLLKMLLNTFNCAVVVRVYGNHLYGDFTARQSSNITWRTISKLFDGKIKNANQY